MNMKETNFPNQIFVLSTDIKITYITKTNNLL